MTHGSSRWAIVAVLVGLCWCRPVFGEPTPGCERAVAVKEPCDGVLMPRAWALECAVLKRQKTAGATVAPEPKPWYASQWFAFVLGIPVGGAAVWAATR